MIWGEVVNSVRSIHLGLLEECGVDPQHLLKDVDLKGRELFAFPEAIDDFEDWNEFVPAQALEDILPLHPVERVILEGPLLPIQKIKFNSSREVDTLFSSILALEKEWAEALKLMNPKTQTFLERMCGTQALRLSTRAGFRKLGTV
jgi:hypothetical protein